ncbi:hypothetical protein [Rhodococcus qingshengii]|uniref:hypothetical protein n=1 Tax=Rhodococcus qingshengii TaxID=334542 RepID=UPI0035DBDA80
MSWQRCDTPAVEYWGEGPLENTAGQSLMDEMCDNHRRANDILMFALTGLEDLSASDEPQVIRGSMATALAACAITADFLRDRYHYVPHPEVPEDFHYCMIKKKRSLFVKARKVLEVYRTMERHYIDLEWPYPECYQRHRRMLAEMTQRLSK